MSGRVAVALLAFALAACASAPAKLHFGMLDAPEGRRVQFPPEPEVPRFLYAGQLVGERNFRRAQSERAGLRPSPRQDTACSGPARRPGR